MPSIPLMQLPKSRSAEEFENICKDVLTFEYGIKFNSYGRNGQKQNGIDIYAQLNEKNYIVAQCKNYFSLNSANTINKQIEKDVKATENIPFHINQFIAMTSMDRDLNVQNYIENIDSPFRIQIWFWEDIQVKVCSNDKLFETYYPSFFQSTQIPIRTKNEIVTNLNILINIAKYFNEKKDYQVAYHYEDDMMLYNQCVQMFNAACKINYLKNEWYIQCQEKKITDKMEKVINFIPDFHDATRDSTGATMIYTLTNFLEGFNSDEETGKFVKWCKKIINLIEK